MSPTIGTSTRMFLLIDEGSMSMCTIFSALGAKSLVRPVTRSSNRAPTAISASQFWTAMFVQYPPCIPNMPRQSGSPPGYTPRAMTVVVIGILRPRTSSVSGSAAPDHCTPPPT